MQNKVELIEELESLLEKQKKIEILETQLDEANGHLRYLNSLNEKTLEKFDEEHKEAYIYQNVGKEPREPWIFKGDWEERHARWKRNYNHFEKQYYQEYEAQRNELMIDVIEKHREETGAKIQDLTEEISQIRKSTITENVMLDSKMQTSENILALIDYLKGSRADTLKEAINLLLNDQFQNHVNETLEAIKERLNNLEELVDSHYEELKQSIQETDDWVEGIESRVSDLESSDSDDEYDDSDESDDDEFEDDDDSDSDDSDDDDYSDDDEN